MNVFLRRITQSVLMVESDIALVVYKYSLGISHGYFNHTCMLPLHQINKCIL